jgi:hypothetical protein
VRDCCPTRPSEGTLGMAPSMTASKASLWHRRDSSSLPARLFCVCRPVPPAMRHVAHTTLLCLCVLSDIARGVFVSHRGEPTRLNWLPQKERSHQTAQYNTVPHNTCTTCTAPHIIHYNTLNSRRCLLRDAFWRNKRTTKHTKTHQNTPKTLFAQHGSVQPAYNLQHTTYYIRLLCC